MKLIRSSGSSLSMIVKFSKYWKEEPGLCRGDRDLIGKEVLMLPGQLLKGLCIRRRMIWYTSTMVDWETLINRYQISWDDQTPFPRRPLPKSGWTSARLTREKTAASVTRSWKRTRISLIASLAAEEICTQSVWNGGSNISNPVAKTSLVRSVVAAGVVMRLKIWKRPPSFTGRGWGRGWRRRGSRGRKVDLKVAMLAWQLIKLLRWGRIGRLGALVVKDRYSMSLSTSALFAQKSKFANCVLRENITVTTNSSFERCPIETGNPLTVKEFVLRAKLLTRVWSFTSRFGRNSLTRRLQLRVMICFWH